MYRKNKDSITVSHPPTPIDARYSSLVADVDLSASQGRRASIRSSAVSPARTPQPPEEEDDEKTDIMISYSHQDRVFMEHLRSALTDNGLTVWIDRTGLGTGDNFLSKIGSAIINAKVFLAIISPNQIQSKYCRDELSLAYVSDKPIIPVALHPQEEVFPLMQTGMKLQLASFEWLLFDTTMNEDSVMTEEFDRVFAPLLAKIHSAIGKAAADEEETEPNSNPSMRKTPRTLLRLMSERSFEARKVDFWTEHFQERNECHWDEFIQCFESYYKDQLSQLYGKDELQWLFNMLHKELNVDSDGRLSRVEYENFKLDPKGHVPFFDRINEYAIESFAVREVFRIESSVRVDAIENLGKFRSTAVIEALLDLLNDHDPNIRAVALVSLARTGHNADRTIRRICNTLNDPDRLVRESACLALGRLKNKSDTVAKLVLERWRNDVISSVRESAELALHQLDSEPARVAIRMTEILQKEIKLLKD